MHHGLHQWHKRLGGEPDHGKHHPLGLGHEILKMQQQHVVDLLALQNRLDLDDKHAVQGMHHAGIDVSAVVCPLAYNTSVSCRVLTETWFECTRTNDDWTGTVLCRSARHTNEFACTRTNDDWTSTVLCRSTRHTNETNTLRRR